MTTRYDERTSSPSILGVVHETGHALYEMGLPRAWVRQPVGQAAGMGLHESQSLLMEMQAARSPEFLGYSRGVAAEELGVDASMLSKEALLRHALRVQRSFIRVDADEATYPLHVIVRFTLERALLSGDLAIGDLPGAFRDAMERVVGIRPTTDRDGACRTCTGRPARSGTSRATPSARSRPRSSSPRRWRSTRRSPRSSRAES